MTRLFAQSATVTPCPNDQPQTPHKNKMKIAPSLIPAQLITEMRAKLKPREYLFWLIPGTELYAVYDRDNPVCIETISPHTLHCRIATLWLQGLNAITIA